MMQAQPGKKPMPPLDSVNGPFSPLSHLSKMTHSGPHPISDEQRRIHHRVRMALNDVLPIRDKHKISDDDLIFRHLIAKQWKEKEAVASVREYVKWREEQKVDSCNAHRYSVPIRSQLHGYFMTDREGHPVYYDQPNPTELAKLVEAEDYKSIINWHIVVAEMGRRLAKENGVDRMTAVLDLRHVGMGILANGKAFSLLRECSSIDQHKYPENMRVMCIINAPGSFKFLWNAVKKFLEERVQKKVRVVSKFDELDAVIPLERVPKEFGGKADGFLKVSEALDKEKAAEAERLRQEILAKKAREEAAEREGEENGILEKDEGAASAAGNSLSESASALKDLKSPIAVASSAQQQERSFSCYSEVAGPEPLPDADPGIHQWVRPASPPFPCANEIPTPRGPKSVGDTSSPLVSPCASDGEGESFASSATTPPPLRPSARRARSRDVPQRSAAEQWRPIVGIAPRPLPLLCHVLVPLEDGSRRQCNWERRVLFVDDEWEFLELHRFCAPDSVPVQLRIAALLELVIPLNLSSSEEAATTRAEMEQEIGADELSFLELQFLVGRVMLAFDLPGDRELWLNWFWGAFPLSRPRPAALAHRETSLTRASLFANLISISSW